MLPIETINAVFPHSVRAGKTLLGPITLAHVVALEAFGISVTDGELTDGSTACVAAWIMTKSYSELKKIVCKDIDSDDVTAWMSKHGICQNDCENAFTGAISHAFSTYVPPKKDDNKIVLDDLPEGYGWPLEICECLAHEYSLSPDEVYDWPVVKALAMIAVIRSRSGGESGGSDYYGRIREERIRQEIKAMREAAKNNVSNKETENGKQ